MAITEIADLATVKTYLRIPVTTTTDDTILSTVFMPAAQKVIEFEIGRIVAKPIQRELHDGGRCEIWLREKPVLYVQNVQEGWGFYDWNLDDQQVNQIPALSIWAYSLDMPEEGLITRRAAGNVNVPFVSGRNNIRVDYVVGRTEMPENAVLVFCELVSFWYRNSQLRAVNAAGTLGMGAMTAFGAINTDIDRKDGSQSPYAGIPEGLLELLKPNRRRPIIG